MTCIEARGLRKHYGKSIALDGVDLRVEEGRIVGLIGPNGAGKSTALHAMLGLTSFDGELKVLGRDPWNDRDALMRDVCFIADVAVLPRWIKVSQALDYIEGVHPRFDRAKAQAFLAKTSIRMKSRVRTLSKGMVVQLHLALVGVLHREAHVVGPGLQRFHDPGREVRGHPVVVPDVGGVVSPGHLLQVLPLAVAGVPPPLQVVAIQQHPETRLPLPVQLLQQGEQQVMAVRQGREEQIPGDHADFRWMITSPS